MNNLKKSLDNISIKSLKEMGYYEVSPGKWEKHIVSFEKKPNAKNVYDQQCMTKKEVKNSPSVFLEIGDGSIHSGVSSFSLCDQLPTLNEYIYLERSNKFLASSLKKKYTNYCAEAARSLKGKIDKNGLYNIVIRWTVENNKTDSDNIFFGVKFILDGLVKAEVINSDGRKNIQNIYNVIITGQRYFVDIRLLKA